MKSLQLAFAASLVWITGCGSAHDGPTVFDAGGVVTYQGRPAEGCQVILSPLEISEHVFSVQGTTDDQGRFSLVTSNRTGSHHQPGAAAGKYSVAITKFDNFMATGDAPLKNHLPRKYSRPNTSRLEAVVTPEGPNEFVYALTD